MCASSAFTCLTEKYPFACSLDLRRQPVRFELVGGLRDHFACRVGLELVCLMLHKACKIRWLYFSGFDEDFGWGGVFECDVCALDEGVVLMQFEP